MGLLIKLSLFESKDVICGYTDVIFGSKYVIFGSKDIIFWLYDGILRD